MTEQMFAQYLAGLIDADGHFSKIPQCVISFHITDKSLAFFIKSRIGYGTVTKVKNKRAYKYVCAHTKGVTYIARLVQPYLNHPSRQDQLKTRVLAPCSEPQRTFLESSFQKNKKEKYTQPFPTVTLCESHWFAGFVEGDGSLQIKTSRDVRVMLQIDQKDRVLLDVIKQTFGGYVGFRKDTQTFYYSSTSFENAFALVKYFDCFRMIGRKRLDYVYWRKCVVLISQKRHLTQEGLEQIVAFKAKLKMLREG
jgi:hypothetical protein